MTEEEYKAFWEKIRLERNARAREYYQKRKERKKHVRRTSWQWLAWHNREVLEGAPVSEKTFDVDGETKTYYYYERQYTKPCRSKKRYEELKKSYIEKYGGWDSINLDDTTYNGKKWY